MTDRKRLNLITGPSGAGKTVYCKGQPDWDHCLLNLDDFARSLGNVDDHEIRTRAWEALVEKADRRMAFGQPVICIDSVFSESDFEDIDVLRASHGYEVALWVLSPALPETCAGRIAQRKSTGGHGLPELAGELYESALSAASNFSLQCEYTFLVDTRGGPEPADCCPERVPYGEGVPGRDAAVGGGVFSRAAQRTDKLGNSRSTQCHRHERRRPLGRQSCALASRVQVNLAPQETAVGHDRIALAGPKR